MAFTPSNLYTASMGSLKATGAWVNASITSGTNNWASGITDILAIHASYRDVSANGSTSCLMVSFTGSDGTIWVMNPVQESGTPFMLWIYSGLTVKN